MTIRALIFDVDGTLAETEEAHRRAFNETFTEAGLDWHWSADDYRELLKTTGGKERMRAHRDALGATCPSDGEIANLHRVKTDRYARIVSEGGLTLRPGVALLMEAARAAGLRLAIATTTNHPSVEALCQSCWHRAADEVFDVIAAGDVVARKKPAPDVYLLALERLNLGPHEALAFEDTANGIEAARAAGLAVLALPSTYSVGEDHGRAQAIISLPDIACGRLPKVCAAGA